MTPEELKALMESIRALRAEFEKMVGLQARLDTLEGALRKPDAKEVTIRAELEALAKDATETRAAMEELKKRQRTQALATDPLSSRSEALRMFGMQIRQGLCQRFGCEAPARYRAEADALRQWREQRASLEATAGTAGANIIPTIMEQNLFDTLEEVSSLLSDCDFQPNLPGKMDMPTLTGRPTLRHKRATVDADMTAGTVGIGTVAFDPEEMYIYIPVDNRLIDMSPIALASLVMTLMQQAATEGLVNDLLNGDGTANYNGVTGFLNEATAAYVYSMPAGKTAFADLADIHLQAMVSKALKRGRARGKWYLAQDVYFGITNLNREGKVPLLTYNGQNGMPLLLGRPVEIDEGMPGLADSAAAKAFMGFGDLATYLVGLVNGVKLDFSQHILFNKNQTAFRLVLNGDIVRKPVATFITGKTAAA